MPFFEARIQWVKVTVSPFAPDEMMDIAQVTLDHIRTRIQSVKDWEDNPAKPLKDNYAKQKVKGRRVARTGGQIFRGLPVRDWTLRGRTLQSLKVKYASQDRATIGPTSEEANMIIAVRNKLDHMWGLAPSDLEAMYAAIRATLMRSRTFLHIEKEARAA
jgi:hypothetical protein